MGFEPFIIPKREPSPDKNPQSGNREERVLALARLLHSRGLTSSMTDAKRLAEGMVDVERKVVTQESKAVAEKATPTTRSDIASTNPHQSPQKTAFNLALQPEFAQFVANAATLSHETIKPVTIQAPRQTAPTPVAIPPAPSMSYGREAQQSISEVPHSRRQSQQFYDEAPDWTKLRGYKGPAPKSVDYPSQKMEFSQVREAAVKKLEDARASPASTMTTAPVPTATDHVIRVETGDGIVKVTEADVSPDIEVVQETMIVEEAPDKSSEERNPVITPATTVTKKPEQKAVESIDLFDFFKKKS